MTTPTPTSSNSSTDARRFMHVPALRDAVLDQPWRFAAWAHWATLAFAGGFLAWADRHQWFAADEWAFLVRRGISLDDLVRPHNEHWTAFPFLVYRGLFELFGVRTYAPYLAVVIVAHLTLAHLLWRLLKRMGADPWLTTAAVGLFAVLGIGWENLTSGFQITLFVPLIFAIGALLVLERHPVPSLREELIAAALLVLALPWSGTGLFVAILVGLCTLLRRGLRAAAIVSGPAGAVYVIWYLAEARNIHGAGEQPLRTALQDVPSFVWRGLVDASEHSLGLKGIGPVVLVLLALFLLHWVGRVPEIWPEVVVLAAGSALFLGLTALRRSGLGIASAGAPRYSYLVVALLLPAAVFALDRGLGHSRFRAPAAIALGLVLLIVQLSTFNTYAATYASIKQEHKHRILATAQLLGEGQKTVVDQPVPDFDPDLTMQDLRRLRTEGDLPGNVTPTRSDLLSAATWVQVAVTEQRPPRGEQPSVVGADGTSLSGGAPTCVRAFGRGSTPEVTLRFARPGRVRLRPGRGLTVSLSLSRDGAHGRPRSLELPGDRSSWLDVRTGGDVHLGFPADRTLELCGLDTAI